MSIMSRGRKKLTDFHVNFCSVYVFIKQIRQVDEKYHNISNLGIAHCREICYTKTWNMNGVLGPA